jgi:tellurite resistance protein TerA
MTINMSKRQTFNLTKPKNVPDGNITVHIVWNQKKPERRGLFRSQKQKLDIDLATLYELKDGTVGVVQELGELYGSLDTFPWIKLSGDDRTGGITGETISMHYGIAVEKFKRLGVLLYIYEGVSTLSEAENAVTTIRVPGLEPYEIRHEGDAHNGQSCAVALFTNNGTGFDVHMDVQPIYGDQRLVDAYWGWGINWGLGL